ncbi:MAG: peptidase domain-containing ABC transporter [Cyanobacteria bacterium P01_F01_bin.150]
MITEELHSQLDWQQPPLSWLSPEQQKQVEAHATPQRFKLGEVIWDTDKTEHQFLILSGNVRLMPDGGSPILLKAGDWFGALPQLSDRWKARGASKEVVVVQWPAQIWTDMLDDRLQQSQKGRNGRNGRNGDNTANGRNGHNGVASGNIIDSSQSLKRYWTTLRSRYQPNFSDAPQPVDGYPFVAGVNTAAACLTMLSQHFGTPVQLEWMQRQLRSQRPRHVIDGSEKVGLQIRRLLVATWDDLRQITLPGLTLWQGERWVVVYEARGDRLVIADPINPDYVCESVPREVVQENWDGELWQVELVKKQDKFNLSWFLPAVMRYKGLLFEVLVASFTLQLLGLTTPILTQVVIDKVMVQQSIPTLDVIAIAMLGVATFEAILGILRMFIFTHTTNRLDLSLSAQLFRHLLRLPLSYFEARRVGDTVARVQELEEIRQFLTSTALTVVLDSIFSVIYLLVMLYYSPKLTGVALAVIPLFAILTLTATPILRNWLNETFNRSADSQSFLVETVTGIHTVKAHAAEKATRDRWEGLYARFIRTGFKANTTANISNNIGNFLTSFSSLLLLWVGAHLVIKQEFTIGQLIAFQMLSARVTGPLLRLVQLWQNLQEVLLAVDRIGDILNVPPEAEQGTGLVLPTLRGAVTFDQVFFRYNQEQDSILKGVSFKVDPGMFVGLVGRSGSGKSTLSKLIQRLYDTESGRIAIDGFDIKSADLASLRPQIAVVLQDDFLFNGTVLDNITLGSHNADAEDVIRAAQMAVAHDFILDLPHGYETNVGERGIALSGGQRQRITLARLFLSQAPILILDEATSHLDAETEQQVLENLRSISSDRTVFLIAHRFAPLKNADLILAMEKGVVVERGTHESLLRDKGLYYSLYQRQQASV